MNSQGRLFWMVLSVLVIIIVILVLLMSVTTAQAATPMPTQEIGPYPGPETSDPIEFLWFFPVIQK